MSLISFGELDMPTCELPRIEMTITGSSIGESMTLWMNIDNN